MQVMEVRDCSTNRFSTSAAYWEAVNGEKRGWRQPSAFGEHQWTIDVPAEMSVEMGNRFVAICFATLKGSPSFRLHPMVANRCKATGMTPKQLSDGYEDAGLSESVSGLCCTPMDNFIVLAITRQHVTGNLSWRVDAFTAWVDEIGRLNLGGIEGVGEENPYSHNRYYFDLINCMRQRPDLYDNRYQSSTRLACAGFRGIVGAQLGDCTVNQLQLPRLWYGFMSKNYVQEEVTPSFRQDMITIVREWLSLDALPGYHPITDLLNNGNYDSRLTAAVTYNNLRSMLPAAKLEEMRRMFWNESFLYFDGLHWLPSDYFGSYSNQRPWLIGNHVRKLLSFPSKMVAPGSNYEVKPQILALPSERHFNNRLVSALTGTDKYGNVFNFCNNRLNSYRV